MTERPRAPPRLNGSSSRAETEAFKGSLPTFKIPSKPSALAMTTQGVVKRWETFGLPNGSCVSRNTVFRGSCLLFVWRFNFARATTNIAAAATSPATSFAVSEGNTYDGFLTSASTDAAVSSPLAVAFRT